MDYEYSSMGNRIKLRRQELRLKQSELAEQVGISNNHMSAIETGHQNLSMDIFFRICICLKVTPDYLLLGNMHAQNIPDNIADKLRLCSQSDIKLAEDIIEILVLRNRDAHIL